MTEPVSLEDLVKDKALIEQLKDYGIDTQELLSPLDDADLPDDIMQSIEGLDIDEIGEGTRRLHEFGGDIFGCYYVVGNKRWGKTTWLEEAAEDYRDHDYVIFDLFDGGDFEGAFWGIRDCPRCHTPIKYDEKVCYKCKLTPKYDAHEVLLVVPPYIDVTMKDPHFKLIDSDVGLKKICETALDENRVVSVACGIFDNDHLFKMLAEWMYQWLQLNRDTFRIDTCFVMREAADIAFARKMTMSKFQGVLKGAMINLIRKAGHCRTVVLFDTQRFMGLDIDVRGNIPYTIVKRHSKDNMSKVVNNLNDKILEQRNRWFYEDRLDPDMINSVRPEVTYLRRQEFYCIFDSGDYGISYNGFPSFHHKGPRDYFAQLTHMSFDQPLFQLDKVKQMDSIRDVPKGILMELNYKLATQFDLESQERAKLFDRKPRTVSDWVKEYERSL